MLTDAEFWFHLAAAASILRLNSMNPLVHFLRFFTIWFGLTQSRPHEESRNAMILGLIMLLTAAFVVIAVTLVVTFAR